MTTRVSREVEERRLALEKAPKGIGRVRHQLLALAAAAARIRFPSSRYADDPVAFCREILGVEPWSKQVEILQLVRDNKRVAVASGHKVGKSMSAAILALWFYCSFPDARAIMSSTTSRQVDQILWRELTMIRGRGGRCLACKREDPDGRKIPRPCPHSALIEGEIGILARTGLKSADYREIVGFTAREAEAVAGISGRSLLYIVDEASGVPDVIFEAIQGNRAGGARVVMFSNPTKTSGQFYDAFHRKADFWKTLRVSSEESPNVVTGRDEIPGLCGRDWIEEMREEWGEDSPLYKVRVRGEFPVGEDGKIFTIDAITTSEEAWEETAETGRLFVGLDPAGATGTGDESAFVWRRGFKMLGLEALRGLDDDAHLAHLLELLARVKLPRETPVVVLDREGPIGSSLYGLLRQHANAHPGSFDIAGVRSSDRAIRKPLTYDRLRDELTANLADWVRDGGAVLRDTRLSDEMHSVEWEQQVNGRLKVTRKTKLKQELGRSPDRYDALALSVWEPLSLKEERPPSKAAEASTKREAAAQYVRPSMDPYSGGSAWRPKR